MARLFAAVLLLVALAAPFRARANDNTGALWLTAIVQVPIAERYDLRVLVQPRFDDDISRVQRLLVRPWFEIAIRQGFAAAFGYDAHILFNPVSTLEQRIFQQISHQHAWEHFQSFLWFRLEQRFFENNGSVPIRGRFLFAGTIPFGREFLAFVANEFFVNFNAKGPIQERGYRENRAAAALGLQIGPWTRLFVGYQMQWIETPLPTNLINHTLMLTALFKTPTLGADPE